MRQAPNSFDSFDFINSDNWIAEGDTPISVFPSNSFDLAAELINPVVDGTVSFTRSEFSLISGQMAVAHVRLSEEIPGENNAQGEVGLVGLGGEYLGIYFQNGVATASDGTVLLNLGNFTKDEWYGVMFFVD